MVKTTDTRRGMVRTGLAACLGLGLAVAHADVPHDFTSGTTIRADEVNANFQDLDGKVDDLDQRVTGLEEGPGGSGEVVLTADCASDDTALQYAIEGAPSGATIEFSGTCGPIVIRVDGLTVLGTGSAEITST